MQGKVTILFNPGTVKFGPAFIKSTSATVHSYATAHNSAKSIIVIIVFTILHPYRQYKTYSNKLT